MERERPCAMFDKRYQVSVPFFTVKKIWVVYVSNFFSKYIFSISNILENIIIFYLKHNVKIMI